MADNEPDEDALRHAFESFRSGSLDAVSPAGPDAVRVTTRRRHRTRVALTSAAAAVVLVVGAGAAVLATRPTGSDSHRGAVAASGDTSRRATASDGASPSTPRIAPSGRTRTGDSDGGHPASHDWSVALGTSSPGMHLSAGQSGTYEGALAVTIGNTGARLIPTTVVELSMGRPVTFVGTDGAGSCADADPCLIQTITDLNPGESRTVRGTLSLAAPDGAGTLSAPPPVTATVRATATDSGDATLTSQSQTVTLSVDGDNSTTPPSEPPASPSTSPSDSASPDTD